MAKRLFPPDGPSLRGLRALAQRIVGVEVGLCLERRPARTQRAFVLPAPDVYSHHEVVHVTLALLRKCRNTTLCPRQRFIEAFGFPQDLDDAREGD
jgi:hypothetical protein